MSEARQYIGRGIGGGAAFALVLSWTTWHSFWWAVLHSFLSWIYVAWFFLIKNYDQVRP